MTTKPSLPKGTRDFGPDVMLRRNHILDTIRNVFSEFGYLPLETPAMENLSVLTGKYGEEGDRLLFRILNSGDFLSKVSDDELSEHSKLGARITEKGLRYDLTVPFARFVAMNRHEITLPFKRYQVQPVWRADRPQKGRYREFYQCDADVVGSESLLCEAEIVLMINKVFSGLNITNYSIKYNHRAILEGICDLIGTPEKLTDLSVSIDKLDKIGWDGVVKELENRGFSSTQVSSLQETFTSTEPELSGTRGERGLHDLENFRAILNTFPGEKHIEFDMTLARGLSYYTGMIFEVQITDSGIGSVSGGGRYDDLTGVFGVPDIPGVGFSFGVDRLYDAMETLELFPDDLIQVTDILIVHFDGDSFNYGLKVLAELRESGIPSELYPDQVKIKKQMSYADKKGIPHVIVIGSDEINTGKLTLKDMRSGTEQKLELRDVIDLIKS